MTKWEIENQIIDEMREFLLQLKGIPFDKGLPIVQKKAWELADKYDTDGANVMNLVFSRWSEIENHNQAD